MPAQRLVPALIRTSTLPRQLMIAPVIISPPPLGYLQVMFSVPVPMSSWEFAATSSSR